MQKQTFCTKVYIFLSFEIHIVNTRFFVGLYTVLSWKKFGVGNIVVARNLKRSREFR